MAPIRLGVIGTGLIWIRTHQAILETHGDTFALIAFCDLDEQRRATLAREFPGATVVGEQQELLAMPEVEAVLVLTPIALNAPTARAALLAGKHVIMEKPIARSVAEGRDLIATARQAGKHLFICEQLAYRHAEDALREIIATGEIGELIMWERVHHLEADTGQGAMRYESTAWRKQADFPLGTMFDGGIHLIAGLSKVFGIPETVVATGRKLRPEYGEYDYIATMFQYAGGITGMVSYSTCLPATHNHFHVIGTSGTIVVEAKRISVEKPGEPQRVVELEQENAYVAMWHALAQAFRDQRDPFYTPEKALHDVAILQAVDQAIKTGGRVSIDAAGSP